MSAFTLQLPAGTNRTELINFPECGSWVGAVGFSLSSLTQVDISELLVINFNEIKKWNNKYIGWLSVNYIQN